MNAHFVEDQTKKIQRFINNPFLSVMPLIRMGCFNWMKDETETEFMAEGFTILGLKQQYDMTYPAALLSIDWILKDPDNAVKCIKKGLR